MQHPAAGVAAAEKHTRNFRKTVHCPRSQNRILYRTFESSLSG
jgi:hypothetical protein